MREEEKDDENYRRVRFRAPVVTVANDGDGGDGGGGGLDR